MSEKKERKALEKGPLQIMTTAQRSDNSTAPSGLDSFSKPEEKINI